MTTYTYEFTITLTVTAFSPEEAAEFALADLRDETLEWTDYTVKNVETGEVARRGVG